MKSKKDKDSKKDRPAQVKPKKSEKFNVKNARKIMKEILVSQLDKNEEEAIET